MALGIDLNKTFNPMFRTLRQRLLLSYLAVMVTIFGTSAVAMYLFFARSLYWQLDSELLTLAKAAAPSVANAKGEVPRPLDEDIPWSSFFQREQSLEWFSTDRKLLTRVGPVFSTLPLGNRFIKPEQQGQIRTLTLHVYGYGPNQTQPHLEGYVRASKSIEGVEHVLMQLRWGIGLGGFVALSLTGIGGMWLTRQALEPIECSFGQLKQFTADASHELRSPLTVIKTSIEVMLMLNQPLDAKKLTAITSATNQMTRLVEDLLFLARTDTVTGTIPFERIPIPLDEVLQDLVELLEPQIQAKEITLKTHWLAGVSVAGDASQLTRLFSNLLENALHYTLPGGTVVLSMSSLNRSVIVSVEDTGIGIAPEHLPKVFHRFWRTDKARSRREGGLGLGLAIAQAIAQRHGGEITVSSQVGVGSCFQVHLPTVQWANTQIVPF